MAKQVDARDSKSRGGNTMSVRFRLSAPDPQRIIIVKSCVFCSIYTQQIPAPIVAENEHVFVIKDISPKAPIHLLIISKKHIPTIADITESDTLLSAALLQMAATLSGTIPGAHAFRLVSNNGASAGQSVHHIHIHFLAGPSLPGFE